MVPNLPQAPEYPGMTSNPHGGTETPICPCCGQQMPMPFNNTDTPQVPIDPRLLTGADQMQPAGNPLMDAIMGMGGGAGGAFVNTR